MTAMLGCGGKGGKYGYGAIVQRDGVVYRVVLKPGDKVWNQQAFQFEPHLG